MKKTFRLAISGLAVAGFAFAGLAGPVSAKVHRPAAHPKGTVAFLGPEQFTGRWPKDAKYFKQKLHSLDKRLKILEYNANANINLQTQQFNTALAKGAKVIVLAAVDQNEDAPLVNKAESQGVKVIAYDRMIQSPKLRAYVSFNNVTVVRNRAAGSRPTSRRARPSSRFGAPRPTTTQRSSIGASAKRSAPRSRSTSTSSATLSGRPTGIRQQRARRWTRRSPSSITRSAPSIR